MKTMPTSMIVLKTRELPSIYRQDPDLTLTNMAALHPKISTLTPLVYTQVHLHGVTNNLPKRDHELVKRDKITAVLLLY